MGVKVRKNESYSKLMLTEGALAVVDEQTNFVMELPEWVDEKKIKIGQKFFFLNLNAMVRAMFYGLLAVSPIESLTRILMFTKQSSTPALAYKRFKANGLHAMLWYKNQIKPGTIAWKSLETVRRMHVVINKRSTKAGAGIISQKDMAITQYLFMGFVVLMPDEFGVVGSREQFEAFNHFWRLIGFMLGTEDRFNACGETLEDTRSRLQSITEDMILPETMNTFPELENYIRIVFDGVWHSDPGLHYDSMIFVIKRAIGVPGYQYFDSESIEGSPSVLKNFSLYTRFRIFIDIMLYEYLSHNLIFRWLLNLCRVILALLSKYPILAMKSFGKKHAYVEIMKGKKFN